MWMRITILFVGILMMAVGTAICNYTGLGIDPFNAFCNGSSALFGISLGTFTLLAQLTLAAGILFLKRSYLGIGSVIPMVFFGYFLQFFNWLLPKMLPEFNGIFLNILVFLPGMLIIAIGMSIYMNCDLGMVPYDCVSFLLSERTKKNAFVLRVVIDTAFAVMALMVRGPISIGTILLALGIGPLLSLAKKGVKRLNDLHLLAIPK